MQLNQTKSLLMQVTTWQRDSHGLFDYQAPNLSKQHFQIKGPCKIFRHWASAFTSVVSNQKVKKGIFPDQPYVFLTSISLKNYGQGKSIFYRQTFYQEFFMSAPQKPSIQIQSRQQTNNQQPLNINTNGYLAVRYCKDNAKQIEGYPMQIGNQIKLGRVQYKVVQLGNMPSLNSKKQQSFFTQFNGIHQINYQKSGTCKFCLCDETTDQDYLISPCKCSGSCEGVHVNCLRHWIDSKVKKQVYGVVCSYNFTKFQCQICKQPFPRFIVKGKKQIQMITIEKPQRPYIILQGINQRNQSKEQRCLHVICPEQGGSAKMGRAHTCQIKLQDISVSRQHAQIKYQKGDFYIKDLGSKFGTLARLDKNIQITNNLKLQCGRSLYEFELS